MSISTWGWGAGAISTVGWGRLRGDAALTLVPAMIAEWLREGRAYTVGTRTYVDVIDRARDVILLRTRPEDLADRALADVISRALANNLSVSVRVRPDIISTRTKSDISTRDRELIIDRKDGLDEITIRERPDTLD